MSIIPTPRFKGDTYCPTRQPGHLAVKSKTEIFNYISKQKSSEEHLCQLDANETKPFWDGENRFNFFFHFSSFLLWQNDTLFIQSLKQKNDWWSNEGQILFQPLTLFRQE